MTERDETTTAARCRRCHRELVDLAALSAQAEAVRRVVAGAVTLAQGGAELEKAYGGAFGLRRALDAQLAKAKALAFEHARAASCVAGTCLIPPANEPAAKP